MGIISKFNFLDYQLQTNHGVHVWNRQTDVKNTEFLGNYSGKSGLGANTGEAAGLEMPPSCVWECLGT